MEIESFIKALRETDPAIVSIYTMGGCYQFARLLNTMYPGGEIVLNTSLDHAAYSYAGAVYDVTGIVDGEWMPMNDGDVRKAQSWSFSRNTFLQVGECPACEEPLLLH